MRIEPCPECGARLLWDPERMQRICMGYPCHVMTEEALHRHDPSSGRSVALRATIPADVLTRAEEAARPRVRAWREAADRRHRVYERTRSEVARRVASEMFHKVAIMDYAVDATGNLTVRMRPDASIIQVTVGKIEDENWSLLRRAYRRITKQGTW
jgi:hypothetical protein